MTHARAGAAVALFAAAGLPVGCGSGDTSPDAPRPEAPKRGGTVTVLDHTAPDSIDPGKTYSNLGFQIAFATQRSVMVQRAKANRPEPGLAAGPPAVSNRGRRLTLRIRDGIRFSPPVNREVTAADVRYAIERGFRRSVANGYSRTYFGALEGAPKKLTAGHPRISGIATPDDHTLVLRLTRKTAGTLVGALSMPLSAPVPREYAAKFDRRTPSTYGLHQVATGPYMLDADRSGRVRGNRKLRLVLVRNPRWDPTTDIRPAYLDRIELRLGLGDSSIVARQVLAGSHMITNSSPPSDVVKRLFARHRDQLDLFSFREIAWTQLNTSLEPLRDLNVRKAILAATDRAFQLKLGGGPIRGTVATHYLPPDLPGFQQAGGEGGFGVPYLAYPSGNLQLARNYLRRAGYPGGRYEGDSKLLTMVNLNTAEARKTGKAFAQTLRQLGFGVRYREMAFADAYELCGRRKEEIHVCAGITWVADFPDAQSVLAPNFKGDLILPENNSNFAQLRVPAIDAAMNRAEAITDERRRARAWAEIDHLIVEQAPAVPLAWYISNGLRSKDVSAVPNAQLGRYDLAYTSIRR